MKLYKLYCENVYPPSEKEMIIKSREVFGGGGCNKRGDIECIVKTIIIIFNYYTRIFVFFIIFFR